MRKTIYFFFMMLLVSGNLTLAQNPIKRNQKPKTEKPNTEQPKTQSGNNSSKKKKPQKAESSSRPQSSSSRSGSFSSSSQSSVPTTRSTEPKTYKVTFSCNVPDADLYIDDKDYGHPKGTHSLHTGSYLVKLVAEGYDDYTTNIQVNAGSTSFDFTMTRMISTDPNAAITVTFTVKGVSFDMIYVEGGLSQSDYYIGKYEVTQELWDAVMENNPSKFKNSPKNPVENVTWDDCQKFVWKLNQLTGKSFRLPTEAEWDFAAHGGNKSKGYRYAGGDNLDAVAWYDNNSEGKTHPVGMKLPNELGIYDMSGNVREWCLDTYISKSQTNTQGTSSSMVQFIPGVGWCVGPAVSLSGKLINNSVDVDSHVYKSLDDPVTSHHYMGLRLAADSL